jgi:hypothetical protein
MVIETWQIFNVAKLKLRPGTIQSIFRRSSRLVCYWAANPRVCDENKRNPIDRIRLLLDELNMAGYGEYDRAAIDHMAEPLGGKFEEFAPCPSDKGDINGEIADIAIAVGELATRIRESKKDGHMDTVERVQIKEAARIIKQEVEQLLDAAGIPS